MRKIFSVLLVLFLALSLYGCKNNETVAEEVDEQQTIENEEYRSIVVGDIKGVVRVIHSDSKTLNAYEGMSLVDGDKVEVEENSSLTLNVDSDKHLYAEPNTIFTLKATGTEESNNTQILLNAGSVLCNIKEKLKEEETFEIVTASSTMSVRGTVFRSSVIASTDENQYDLVEVYDGKVWSSISEEEGKNVTLEPGQCAIVKNSKEDESPKYVLDDQIDEAFWKSSDTNIYTTKDEGTGSPVLEISTNKLSSNMAGNLIDIIEDGTELAVDKKVLEEVKEEKADWKEVTEDHNGVKVTKYVLSECQEKGHVSVIDGGFRVCSRCGEILGLVKKPDVPKEPIVTEETKTESYTKKDGTVVEYEVKKKTTVTYDEWGLPSIHVEVEMPMYTDPTPSGKNEDGGEKGEGEKPSEGQTPPVENETHTDPPSNDEGRDSQPSSNISGGSLPVANG